MDILRLRKELQALGIRVQGTYVKKSDIRKFLTTASYSEPIEIGGWEKFAEKYEDAQWDPNSLVEAVDDKHVKLKDEHAKELERTYTLFTDGKEEQETWEGVKKSIESVLDKAIDKAIEKLGPDYKIDKSEIGHEIIVDDSDKVSISYNDEDLELSSFYYLGQEDWPAVIGDSFNSWEWLALLADSDSPFYDSGFEQGYTDVQKAQTASELISYDDHTEKEWVEQISKFLEANYEPTFEDWKKQVDEHAEGILGMKPDDISGDYRWRDLFDDGFTAEEAYTSWKEDLPEDLYTKVRSIEKGE